MANLLKSELTKGLTVIGTSTIDEFTKKIEKSGLEPLFEKVELLERRMASQIASSVMAI